MLACLKSVSFSLSFIKCFFVLFPSTSPKGKEEKKVGNWRSFSDTAELWAQREKGGVGEAEFVICPGIKRREGRRKREVLLRSCKKTNEEGFIENHSWAKKERKETFFFASPHSDRVMVPRKIFVFGEEAGFGDRGETETHASPGCIGNP